MHLTGIQGVQGYAEEIRRISSAHSATAASKPQSHLKEDE
jgi:hypothetical protein